MDKGISIIRAIKDQKLFRQIFKDLSSWSSWIVALKSIFALPMDDQELALYKSCTQRERPPNRPFKEVYFIVGRRGGKSFIVAIIACFLALFKDYSQYLAPGERGALMILANDRKQSGIILRYIKAILNLPMFKRYVQAERAESVELTNGIDIQVATCSYRAVRGYTLIGAILEESAFWRVEGANPDREVKAALLPGMQTIPDAMMFIISTPYSRGGILYDGYKNFFGKEDEEVLVWQAPSIIMNPTLNEKKIAKEIAKDPAAAKSEYEATFREDLEDFITLDVLEKVVVRGRSVLPPCSGFVYFGFADPSGGGADEFTLSVGHMEGQKVVQDVLLAMKGDPHSIAAQYADELKKYGLSSVTGDKYAGAWVSEAFRKGGIEYVASELNKSELYLAALPHLHSGQAELLDDEIMTRQFRMLERRRGSSGRDSVDHPSYSGGAACHDDRSNVSAGLIAIGKQLETAPTAWELPYATQGGGRSPGIGAGRQSETWLSNELAVQAEYERRRRGFVEPRQKKEIWDRDY